MAENVLAADDLGRGVRERLRGPGCPARWASAGSGRAGSGRHHGIEGFRDFLQPARRRRARHRRSGRCVPAPVRPGRPGHRRQRLRGRRPGRARRRDRLSSAHPPGGRPRPASTVSAAAAAYAGPRTASPIRRAAVVRSSGSCRAGHGCRRRHRRRLWSARARAVNRTGPGAPPASRWAAHLGKRRAARPATRPPADGPSACAPPARLARAKASTASRRATRTARTTGRCPATSAGPQLAIGATRPVAGRSLVAQPGGPAAPSETPNAAPGRHRPHG